ncbi:MAG: hypothetical protein QOJ19_4685 [Acidimicrobiia bacterium]|nr:hypothetical protein [Acidimicrobiia bacterium]
MKRSGTRKRSFLRQRLRLLLVGRVLAGDSRRWLMYLGLSALWRRLRKLRAGEPELVYRAVLSPGERLDVRTDRPLPPKLASRKLRRQLEAAYRAELEQRAAN